MPLGIHEIFKIIIKKNLCLSPLSTTVWCTFAKRKTPRTQSWPAPPSAAAYPCIDCTVAHIEDDIILKELQVPTNYVKLQILKRGTQSFSFDSDYGSNFLAPALAVFLLYVLRFMFSL